MSARAAWRCPVRRDRPCSCGGALTCRCRRRHHGPVFQRPGARHAPGDDPAGEPQFRQRLPRGRQVRDLRCRRNGFERQLGTTAARYGNATWSARPFKRASLRKANSQTARSMDIGVPSATQVERCRAKVPRHRREGNKMRSVPQHRLSEQSHAANDKAGNEGNSG